MSGGRETPKSEPEEQVLARRAWSSARQWRLIAAAAAIGVLVILAGWLGERLFSATPQEAATAPPPPGTFRPTAQQLKGFTVETVRAHAFISEELTEGKIAVNGDRATQVFSPYSGRVLKVIAGLGDTVKAGAPLATVEASEFVQAQNDLKSATVQRNLARTSEARKHALYEAKGGSLQDWQSAQADLATAESALNAAKNRLRILGKSAEQIDGLERSQVIDPVATLSAPLAGVVVDRQIGPGQYLQAGGGPLFTIADPSSVWLLANVRESDAALVKVGQPIEVHVLAYPKRAFTARLTQVAAMVDPATHRLPVRAEIDNRDGALKPEMFANFRILTSSAADSPAVPQTAVVYDGARAHVWVLSADGLLKLTEIKIGRLSDGLIEVLEGVNVGERVVTQGGIFIDQAAVPAES